MASAMQWIAKQGIRLLLLLAAAMVITYVLVSLSPIDPVQSYIGADTMRVGPEQREAIAAYWGLDKPPAERFAKWAGALAKGDLGTSMIYRDKVTSVIAERFASSITLMALAWLLSGIIGYIAGAVAAANKGKLLDRTITAACYTLASAPTFWVGLLFLLAGSVWLGWFPAGLAVPAGKLASEVTIWDRLHHIVLPALTLSIAGIAPVALHTRQKLLDVLASDYILFARARGERGWNLFVRHALRNSLLPALTLQFASFGELFGGAVLAEQIFSYPGLGQGTIEAALRGDIPLLTGLVLFSTFFVFIGNAIANGLYRLVDPRMRKAGGGAVSEK